MKFLKLASIVGILGIGLLATPLMSAKSTIVSVTGCLASGPRTHEYTLTDQNGGTFGLVAYPDYGVRMRHHVGQEVMISGNVIRGRREMRHATASGTPIDNEYLRVYQVKRVNASCS